MSATLAQFAVAVARWRQQNPDTGWDSARVGGVVYYRCGGGWWTRADGKGKLIAPEAFRKMQAAENRACPGRRRA